MDKTKIPWLESAYLMLGAREAAGAANNPIIVKLFAEAGHPEVHNDATAWCAAFVGAMLKRNNIASTGTLWALDYAKWGQKLSGPALGAVGYKERRDAHGKLIGGHVFFVAGWDKTHVTALGGNQKDSVCLVRYSRSEIKGYRWPQGVELPAPVPGVYLAARKAETAGSEA